MGPASSRKKPETKESTVKRVVGFASVKIIPNQNWKIIKLNFYAQKYLKIAHHFRKQHQNDKNRFKLDKNLAKGVLHKVKT